MRKNTIFEKVEDEINIHELVVHFRSQLDDIPDNTPLDTAFLGNILESFNLKKASTNTIQNRTAKNIIEKMKRHALDFKSLFLKQDANIKQFFEEIAVVLSANYLNQHPQKSINSIEAEHLATVTVETFLCAAIASPVFMSTLAKNWSILPFQIKILPATAEMRASIQRVVDKRTSQYNDSSSKSWYCYAKQKTPLLKFEDDIENILTTACNEEKINFAALIESLLNTQNPIIEAFKQLNHPSHNTLLRARQSKVLGERLSAQIIGQQQAITSVVKGILASSLKAMSGPRLILTFVGPSGVGKTFTASLLAKLLSETEGSAYRFSNYNMESYAEEKDASMLFGSGSQYSDSALGTLTTSVRNYPRQVILFDEIEKAHSSVLSSLLSLLDDGVANDKTTQEPIDFSQCIIIFTSNLGQETFRKNTAAHNLNVFDVLKTAKNPDTRVGFSPELVNRLAKGYPIIFKELKVNHLIRLAESEIAKQSESMQDILFTYPADFASFVLQSISPEISVRRLQTSIAKLQADILLGALDHIPSEQDKTRIDVEMADDLQSSTEVINVLILASNSVLSSAISTIVENKMLPDSAFIQNITTQHCPNISVLEKQLVTFKPDAVLIDVEHVKQDNDQQRILDTLQCFNKDMAIFTFNTPKVIIEQPFKNLHHDIREHFSLASDNSSLEQYQNLLSRVYFYLVTERQVKKITQRHQSLTFKCEYQTTATGATFKLSHFNYEQLTYTDDITNNTLFKYALPTLTLKDVIGLERAKKRLVEIIEWMKNPNTLLMANVKLPTGFLFSGPPGTGKTMLAKALAGECQMPFFSVSAADLSSKYTGATTENIKQLFNTARKYAPAIIFIDEIDAIGGARNQNNSADAHMVVNTLLTEMDGFNNAEAPIFVLAATNYPALLDPALTRPGRFDETITCDLPNKEARYQFFERFICERDLQWPITETEKLVLRTHGFSSALIDQVLRESVYESISSKHLITPDSIHNCITRISYGLPSDSLIMSEEEKIRTAYHETGHLLTHKLLFPKVPIEFITIIPREQALGFVATRRPDEYNGNTRDSISRKLQVLLAGRVAEKIFHDSSEFVSTGAASDIEKATQIAMSAIYEGGLSSEIGAVNLNLLTKFEESELLHLAQENVRQWIAESEEKAETLLIENKALLHYFAKALLQQESMHAEQIEKTLTLNFST
ncbi:MAG: AAA family ATPase [Paraglaciecola sp.]|nr:AAA family ATPase [Paraglaciecola sp.]